MEYEIEQLQEDFAKQMGSIDIKTLTDDFIEEMLLQSKPLQGILGAIRGRQRVKLAEIKKEYDAALNHWSLFTFNVHQNQLPNQKKKPSQLNQHLQLKKLPLLNLFLLKI